MGRTSTAKGDMLRSAAALFREKGIDATSLLDVVEHAGAPRGSIYHHFPGGKPELTEHATKYAGAWMGRRLSAGVPEGPVSVLRAVIEEFRRDLVASGYRAGCPVAAAAMGDGPGRQVAGEAFTSWVDTIAAALWQRGLPHERARALAAVAIASIEGALVMGKAQQTTHALESVTNEVLTWIEGLADAMDPIPPASR